MNETPIPPHKIADGWLKKFILAGKAVFTVRSLKSGKHFTFRIDQPSETKPHFVQVLTGPDNERDYTYLGWIKDGNLYFHGTKKSRIEVTAPSAQAAGWTLPRILAEQPLKGVELWHASQCARCGRKLTRPESIESGFGPECIKRI